MAEAMDSSTEIIYIALLGEGTDVVRPTEGKKLADLVYEVLKPEGYDPDNEEWEFPPGSVVRCERQVWSGEELTVAVSLVTRST